ncbi:MAG TPA: flagellar basal body-associated FliL family protein [Candidatus Kapabacteria bacterium]|nr:flagellar basal body-associated FliL family protein [Ignavibacteria bacterium]HRE56446.1 flagellar basal body-associated FliL family protein [Candidatus Kapabacteria bacterium]HRK59603.1 flagellar basal body-associated FliL family protein [Candidatus Kapabacteria bacterium]
MADDADEVEEKPAKPKKEGGGGMKTVLMAAVAGLLVAVVFGAGIFLGVKFFGGSHEDEKSDKPKKEAKSHSDLAAEEEEEEIGPLDEDGNPLPRFVIPTEDFIVNPNGSDRYVVVNLGIEVNSEEAKGKVEKDLMIPIRHGVLKVLQKYTIEDYQRVALRDSLPKIIKKEIRPYIIGTKVSNIYISKFIIQ